MFQYRRAAYLAGAATSLLVAILLWLIVCLVLVFGPEENTKNRFVGMLATIMAFALLFSTIFLRFRALLRDRLAEFMAARAWGLLAGALILLGAGAVILVRHWEIGAVPFFLAAISLVVSLWKWLNKQKEMGLSAFLNPNFDRQIAVWTNSWWLTSFFAVLAVLSLLSQGPKNLWTIALCVLLPMTHVAAVWHYRRRPNSLRAFLFLFDAQTLPSLALLVMSWALAVTGPDTWLVERYYYAPWVLSSALVLISFPYQRRSLLARCHDLAAYIRDTAVHKDDLYQTLFYSPNMWKWMSKKQFVAALTAGPGIGIVLVRFAPGYFFFTGFLLFTALFCFLTFSNAIRRYYLRRCLGTQDIKLLGI